MFIIMDSKRKHFYAAYNHDNFHINMTGIQ